MRSEVATIVQRIKQDATSEASSDRVKRRGMLVPDFMGPVAKKCRARDDPSYTGY